MYYLGGKARLAKHIVPIITADRQPGQWFVEPFCGGCNITAAVDGNRLANDIHYELISLWQALQTGAIPPDVVTKKTYQDVKNNPDKYPPYFRAFVGFGCSFGGKYFGGYAVDNRWKLTVAQNNYNSTLRKAAKLKGVVFTNMDYCDLYVPQNSVIYCDPPYQNTTKYTTGAFDHELFWHWCRNKTKQGHKVFISEYTAPNDFECVWQKEKKVTIDPKKETQIHVEKLFIWKGIL
jgi:DNA adenine methylase